MRRKTSLTKHCPSCLKTFYVRPSWARVRYCSRLCLASVSWPKSRRDKLSQSLKGRLAWNKGLTGLSTWNKGLRFSYKPRPKALGRKAWNKGKKGFLSGSQHYNWQGGITPVHETIRKSLDYKTWRTAVFRRDNYACVWCGDDTSGNLNADHIKMFKFYPHLRFDIANGQTLCTKHHKWKTKWDLQIYVHGKILPLNTTTV